MKGKMSMSTILLLVIGFGVVGYFVWPYLNVPQQAIGTCPYGGVYPNCNAAPDTVVNCPDVAITAQAENRNPLNSSVFYPGTVFVVTGSDGVTEVATGTSTSHTAKSYTGITVPCTPEIYRNGVYVYALGSTTITGAKSVLKTYVTSAGRANAVTADLSSPSATSMNITVRDSSLTNTTDLTSDAVVTESAATAMSSGETRSGYLDLDMKTASSQYGSDYAGLLFAIDTVSSNKFKDTDISLTSVTAGYSLQEIPCSNYPKAQSFDSANRCYVGSTIKSSSGIVRLAWVVSASIGSPGSSDDPVIYIDDIVYGRDSNAQIILDAFDSGGTNLGVLQHSFTLDNS